MAGQIKHGLLLRGLIGIISVHSTILGIVMLAAPRLMLRTFGFPETVPIFFPSQSGVFLLILGISYYFALHEPAFVKVILVSKALAVVFLFAHAAFFAAPPIIWAMLAGDGTMLVALSAALIRDQRQNPLYRSKGRRGERAGE